MKVKSNYSSALRFFIQWLRICIKIFVSEFWVPIEPAINYLYVRLFWTYKDEQQGCCYFEIWGVSVSTVYALVMDISFARMNKWFTKLFQLERSQLTQFILIIRNSDQICQNLQVIDIITDWGIQKL